MFTRNGLVQHFESRHVTWRMVRVRQWRNKERRIDPSIKALEFESVLQLIPGWIAECMRQDNG